MDERSHIFPEPFCIPSALSALDVCARAIIDNRSLPRSVWHDLGAIKRRQNLGVDALDETLGWEIFYPGVPWPHLVDYINYDQTYFLRAPHLITKCFSANPQMVSALFREHGRNTIFRLQPELGIVLTLSECIVNGFTQVINLLITRSTPHCSMTAELFSSFENLKVTLDEKNGFEIQFPKLDPERPLRNSFEFLTFLMDVFPDALNSYYPSSPFKRLYA